MTESIEYGLFLITSHGEILIFTSEDPEEIEKANGRLPMVQPSIIRTRTIQRGDWVW
jgi:hypothetical protein